MAVDPALTDRSPTPPPESRASSLRSPPSAALDEEARTVARRLLEQGGYSPLSADGASVLRGGETLRLEAEPGDVRISLVRGEETLRLEPPRALAAVASRLRRPEAHLWGFSPKGTYVAVRITDDHGPVLREAPTYQVLSMEQARRASR